MHDKHPTATPVDPQYGDTAYQRIRDHRANPSGLGRVSPVAFPADVLAEWEVTG